MPGKPKRRWHDHWRVTIFYPDDEQLPRAHTDRKKATAFAKREKKSPARETRTLDAVALVDWAKSELSSTGIQNRSQTSRYLCRGAIYRCRNVLGVLQPR